MNNLPDFMLENIRRSLGRSPGDQPLPRPPILQPRSPIGAGSEREAEINRLIQEINALSGFAQKCWIPRSSGRSATGISLGHSLVGEMDESNIQDVDFTGLPTIDVALQELVESQSIRKATLWMTRGLAEWRIAERLQEMNIEIIPSNADKHSLAQCDLGVTEVDFALPETGTLVLRSSAERPRAVSLLPRVHLAILEPRVLRPDLHQVFAEAKNAHYLVFITGPSRTADIELTVTLGVHGPKALYAWVINDINRFD